MGAIEALSAVGCHRGCTLASPNPRYAETCELIARLEVEQVATRMPGVRQALSELEKRLGSEERKFNELLEGQVEAWAGGRAVCRAR